jgi:hypothetical protein
MLARGARLRLLPPTLLAAVAGVFAPIAGAAQTVAVPAAPALPAASSSPAGVGSTARWMEVTPLDPHAEAKLVTLPADGHPVRLEALPAGPALVCAGGGGLATVCERV